MSPSELTSSCLCKEHLAQNEEEFRKRTYDTYAEALAQEERVHLFEEETYYQQNPHHRYQAILQYKNDVAEPSCSSNDRLENLKKLYRTPRPAADTPMERLTTLSPINDPHPWLAREAMKEKGIGQGAMDALERRRPAVRLIEIEALPEEERRTTEHMELYHRTRFDVPADKARNLRPTKLRKRRSEKEEQEK